HYQIEPSQLKGSIIVPPSKSHTLRALLFAGLAKGTSEIEAALLSPDTTAMIQAIEQLGAQVEQKATSFTIRGVAGKPKSPDDVIQCGNSGIVLRFLSALAGLRLTSNSSNSKRSCLLFYLSTKLFDCLNHGCCIWGKESCFN